MIDAIPLLDRMIERKQEAFGRYTGRTRLAIRTEIETLRQCRKEILRLEEEANYWYKKAEEEEAEKEQALRQLQFLKMRLRAEEEAKEKAKKTSGKEFVYRRRILKRVNDGK